MRHVYLIGDPAIRDRLNYKLKLFGERLVMAILIVLLLAACFVTGYLIGLTHFYYG